MLHTQCVEVKEMITNTPRKESLIRFHHTPFSISLSLSLSLVIVKYLRFILLVVGVM